MVGISAGVAQSKYIALENVLNKMVSNFRNYFRLFQEIKSQVRTKIKVRWLKIFYQIDVGKGTIIRELKYVNTDYGAIRIWQNCVINALALAGPIEIGRNTLVNLYSDISGRDYKVTIGNDVLIAPRVSIMASMHNYRMKSNLIRLQGTTGGDVVIGNDVWIGTNAVILPGIHIGSGAVIGANAVVNHDVPEYAIAVGVPAKVVGYRE